jgi:hypothetical protein
VVEQGVLADGLVYIAAFGLDDGESPGGLLAQ